MNPSPNPADLACLSPKQIDVLFQLLAGISVAEVAQSVGVHRSTIYLWRQIPAFKTYFHQAAVTRAIALSDKLDCLADLAVENVLHILSNQEHSPSVRLRAAKLVIDNALRPLNAEIRQNSTKFDTSGIPVPVEMPQPADPPDSEPAPTPAEAVEFTAECGGIPPVPVDTVAIDALIDRILTTYATDPPVAAAAGSPPSADPLLL